MRYNITSTESNMSSYNGWANYETWRVNLEMLDGMTLEYFSMKITEAMDLGDVTTELADALEAHCVEFVGMDAKGFALDLALSFLDKVDWVEIAEHMVADAS